MILNGSNTMLRNSKNILGLKLQGCTVAAVVRRYFLPLLHVQSWDCLKERLDTTHWHTLLIESCIEVVHPVPPARPGFWSPSGARLPSTSALPSSATPSAGAMARDTRNALPSELAWLLVPSARCCGVRQRRCRASPAHVHWGRFPTKKNTKRHSCCTRLLEP